VLVIMSSHRNVHGGEVAKGAHRKIHGKKCLEALTRGEERSDTIREGGPATGRKTIRELIRDKVGSFFGGERKVLLEIQPSIASEVNQLFVAKGDKGFKQFLKDDQSATEETVWTRKATARIR